MNDWELGAADAPDDPVAPVAALPDEPADAEPELDLALLPMLLRMYCVAALPVVPVVPVAVAPPALAIEPPRSRHPVTVIVLPEVLVLVLALALLWLDVAGACAIRPATDIAATTAAAPVHVFQYM